MISRQNVLQHNEEEILTPCDDVMNMLDRGQTMNRDR